MTNHRVFLVALCCLLMSATAHTQIAWTLTNASLNIDGNPCNTASSNGWVSGGFSVGKISSGSSGSISASWNLGDGKRAFGLSETSSNGDWRKIDYAFFLSNRNLNIYENGSLEAALGSPKVGDLYTVELTGGNVVYKVNGTIVHTSPNPPGSVDLHAEFALFRVDDCFELDGVLDPPPVYPYAQLLRKVDAGFVRTHDQILRVAYPEDYGQEANTRLYYKILDNLQQVVASVSEAGAPSPGSSPAPVIIHGENHLDMDLSSLALEVGALYTLVTYNRKNERRYLKFVYEQDMPN